VPEGNIWRVDFESGHFMELLLDKTLLRCLKEALAAEKGYSAFLHYQGSRLITILRDQLPLLQQLAAAETPAPRFLEDVKRNESKLQGESQKQATPQNDPGASIKAQLELAKKKVYAAFEKEVPHSGKLLDILLARVKEQASAAKVMQGNIAASGKAEQAKKPLPQAVEVVLDEDPKKVGGDSEKIPGNLGTLATEAEVHHLDPKFENAMVRISCAEEIFDYFRPDIPVETEQQDTGSGFAVALRGDSDEPIPANSAEDPIFITNAHVVRNGFNVRVQLPSMSQDYFDAFVPVIYEDMDLAIVRLKDPTGFQQVLKENNMQLKVLPIRHQPQFYLGIEVAAVGFPLGVRSVKLSRGVISGTHEMEGQVKLQMTAPISPGSSGGPLFDLEHLNKDGEPRVIGVNFAAATQGQSNNYAIPVIHIRQLLHSYLTSKSFQERDPTKHEVLRIAPFRALEVETNDALKSSSKCSGHGIFLSKHYEPSALAGKVPPNSFLVSINNVKLDSYGRGKVAQYLGHSLHWQSILQSVDSLVDEVPVEFCEANTGKTSTVKVTLQWQDSYKLAIPTIREPYFHPELRHYEKFAGMLFVELTTNFIAALMEYGYFPRLQYYLKIENQREKRVVLVRVEPGAYADGVVRLGSVITKVNDQVVRSLEDFQKASTEPLVIENMKVWKMETEEGKVIQLDYAAENAKAGEARSALQVLANYSYGLKRMSFLQQGLTSSASRFRV